MPRYYTNVQMEDVHNCYGLAYGNSYEAKRIYHARFPDKRCPQSRPFSSIHRRLRENGMFMAPTIKREHQRARQATDRLQGWGGQLQVQDSWRKNTVFHEWRTLHDQGLPVPLSQGTCSLPGRFSTAGRVLLLVPMPLCTRSKFFVDNSFL